MNANTETIWVERFDFTARAKTKLAVNKSRTFANPILFDWCAETEEGYMSREEAIYYDQHEGAVMRELIERERDCDSVIRRESVLRWDDASKTWVECDSRIRDASAESANY